MMGGMDETPRESYPGQYSTPEGLRCPVCTGRVDVETLTLDDLAEVERQGYWDCPRGCKPRTLSRLA